MPHSRNIARMCKACSKTFMISSYAVGRGHGVYCSVPCRVAGSVGKVGIALVGQDNPRWKGGLSKNAKGYWFVKMPEHPNAMKSGYVKRATLVMSGSIGRPLRQGEQVHHKNKDREDDNLSNLELTTITEHGSLHKRAAIPKKEKDPTHPHNRRYHWPEDSEIIRLCSEFSLRDVAAKIGCGWSSVWRRLKKIRSHTSVE